MIFPRDLFSIITLLIQHSGEIKGFIEKGLPIVQQIKDFFPKLLPIITDVGTALFPKVSPDKAAEAGADVLFNSHGTIWVQNALNTLTSAGLEVDGSYGARTKAAVETFQKAHQPEAGLVDGWAGRQTQLVIEAELLKLNVTPKTD